MKHNPNGVYVQNIETKTAKTEEGNDRKVFMTIWMEKYAKSYGETADSLCKDRNAKCTQNYTMNMIFYNLTAFLLD